MDRGRLRRLAHELRTNEGGLARAMLMRSLDAAELDELRAALQKRSPERREREANTLSPLRLFRRCRRPLPEGLKDALGPLQANRRRLLGLFGGRLGVLPAARRDPAGRPLEGRTSGVYSGFSGLFWQNLTFSCSLT